MQKRFLSLYGIKRNTVTRTELIKLALLTNKIVAIPSEIDTIDMLHDFVYKTLIVYQNNAITESVQNIFNKGEFYS